MPDPRKLPALSAAEQALMDLVWHLQPVATSDLWAAVNETRSGGISRNTVQTQLNRLAAKGWLSPDDGAGVRRYRATVPAKKGRGRVLADLRERLFGGCGVSLVRCMMEDGGLTQKELGELNTLIEQHRKGGPR